MVLRKFWLYFAILTAFLGLVYFMNLISRTSPYPKMAPYHSGSLLESDSDNYFDVLDDNGVSIFQTGLPVTVGDEYITHDNRHYRVTAVNGWKCRATLLKTADTGSNAKSVSQHQTGIALAQAARIAIYHSHTDESFIPTQGSSSLPGNGGVLRVGEAMAKTLSNNAITVDHSYVKHDPHDINSYYRSRRTVFQLLKNGPTAIFDIHRDSAPSNTYFTYITGVESAKVMIVVGRQNPNMASNLEFARRLKKTADSIYPDLVRGIFIGYGSYNQDLHPRSLLLEIGTDKLPEQLASDAARCMADVIINMFS